MTAASTDDPHRIGIRFPPDLYTQTVAEATTRGISVNHFVLACVQATLTPKC